MKEKLLKLSIKIQNLIRDEQAQDLIEYALVVALVAFAATAGMKSLSNGINTAFNDIAGTLATYIT